MHIFCHFYDDYLYQKQSREQKARYFYFLHFDIFFLFILHFVYILVF